ncbi:uracil phosphoribosyltransferase [Candidatus Babeliales bacterium]|nr:uracil phosphoribosyltransferase [Candidatus Babeliales bacterium]
MKEVLITILRDKNTSITKFRKAAEGIAFILAWQTASHLEKEQVSVDTPITKAIGSKIKNNIILIPILRSALSLVSPFLKVFNNAKVGFLGLKRDEKTFIPKIYYKNFPEISSKDNVIILDPMIATGGSGSEAIKILKESGIKEEKIIFVAVISALVGIKKIKKEYPKVKIICAQEDKELNDKMFIIPGLGDFGDRFFGTPQKI